jgi:hypothetical protein
MIDDRSGANAPRDRSQERGPGGGRRGRRRAEPGRPPTNQGLVFVGLMSLAALVLGGIALYLILTRPAPASASDSCRSVAWSSLPSAGDLPNGWAITASGFYTDGYGAALSGPAPSGQTVAPQVNVRVSCFGTDSHEAMTRSKNSDLALGGTQIQFADLGDEAIATRDAAGTTTSVYVRRGPLVASLAATQAVNAQNLEDVATAIDGAMASAELSVAIATDSGASPGASDALPSDSIPTDDPNATEAPTPTPAHAFPELEALLPKAIDGIALSPQSATASDGLDGDVFPDITDALAKLGKTGDDLHVAADVDESGSLGVELLTAFEVKGMTADNLRQVVMQAWLGASDSGITTSTSTVGGRQVTTVDYGAGSPKDYLYASGDVVIDLSTSDPTLLAKVVAATK